MSCKLWYIKVFHVPTKLLEKNAICNALLQKSVQFGTSLYFQCRLKILSLKWCKRNPQLINRNFSVTHRNVRTLVTVIGKKTKNLCFWQFQLPALTTDMLVHLTSLYFSRAIFSHCKTNGRAESLHSTLIEPSCLAANYFVHYKCSNTYQR